MKLLTAIALSKYFQYTSLAVFLFLMGMIHFFENPVVEAMLSIGIWAFVVAKGLCTEIREHHDGALSDLVDDFGSFMWALLIVALVVLVCGYFAHADVAPVMRLLAFVGLAYPLAISFPRAMLRERMKKAAPPHVG